MGVYEPIVSEPEMQPDQLKYQLLELIKAEKSAFKKVLDTYYQNANPSEEEYLSLNKKLIHSLSRVFKFYEDNNGQESLFLRNTMKPLREALEEAKKVRTQLLGESSGASDRQDDEEKLPENCAMVYVTLYQSGGHDIARWESQLKSLASVMQSRPIYEQAEQAQRAVRKNMSMNSEAYVAICVKNDAIIKGSGMTPRRDRHGYDLVTLKQDALQDESAIREFVLGERHFRFIDGKLVAIDSSGRRFFG